MQSSNKFIILFNLPRLLFDLPPLADTSCDGDDDLAGGVEHVLHLVDAGLHLHVRQVEVGVEDEDNVSALLLVLKVHLGLLDRSLAHHRVEVLGKQAEGCSDQRDQFVRHLVEVFLEYVVTENFKKQPFCCSFFGSPLRPS